MVPAGAGVRAALGPRSAVFLEALRYFLARPATTEDVPLVLGFRLGF